MEPTENRDVCVPMFQDRGLPCLLDEQLSFAGQTDLDANLTAYSPRKSGHIAYPLEASGLHVQGGSKSKVCCGLLVHAHLWLYHRWLCDFRQAPQLSL